MYNSLYLRPNIGWLGKSFVIHCPKKFAKLFLSLDRYFAHLEQHELESPTADNRQ